MSGLAFTPELLERLADADNEARQLALECLDQLSRPLNVREIERALRANGMKSKAAKVMSSGLRGIYIVAVMPKA